MKNVNLSEWALRNRPLVLYFILVLAVAQEAAAFG